MTRTEHLLAILAEECAEVAQRATKALRFGLSEVQPGQDKTNAARIAYELDDLLAVAGMLRDASAIPGASPEAQEAKIEKVRWFLRYSRELGTLSEPEASP